MVGCKMGNKKNYLKNTYAPIVLFTYNRFKHTKQTVETLRKNELASESELFIYSDAPKNKEVEKKVIKVREYIKTIDGFKKVTIIEREKNWGLANSIIDGVTTIINKYGKIIVLEDDLITSPYFLRFMNEALDFYKDEQKVCQINGYSYFEKYINKYNLDDLLFLKGADCLGWATWKRAWDIFNSNTLDLYKEVQIRNKIREFNRDNNYNYMKMLKSQMDGKIDSWAIRWYASAFLKDLYTVYPNKSYVYHTGNDGEGTHYTILDKKYDPLDVPLCDLLIKIKNYEILESKNTINAYNEWLKSYKLPLFVRVKNRIKRTLLK